ncbi:MAG TPA: ester cyclase [Pseudolysinimonas sp.]|nr:ester cyclase [Pseudolysinimonas sp.]
MNASNQTDPAASERSLADVARAFYEPFRTGDTSTYATVLADNWVDIPLAPGQEQGPAGMPDQIAGFRYVMPDYTVIHEDVLVSGDRVTVRNTVTGTHQGAFMGHEPTGRRIEMRTIDIHEIRDGRIVTTWHLEDFAGLLAQLSAPADAPVLPAWS